MLAWGRILGVLALLLSAPDAHAETIRGTFRYLDSGGVLRPIAHSKVEIHRFAPRFLGIWSWALEATIVTDANGVMVTPMPFATQGVIYGVKVFATNYAAQVWPNDALHTVPFHYEPGQPGRVVNLTAYSPFDVLDFSFDFTDAWAPQHYNIADAIRHGYNYANAVRDLNETDPIPVANAQPTSITGSWYNPTVDTVVINSAHVLDDHAILHEYAHFLEEQISGFAWIASVHNGCTARDAFGALINSPEHAWMEGFADYFAQASAARAPAGSLTSQGYGTPGVYTLESQPSPCPDVPANIAGDAIENRVAGTLWDLVDDGSGEVHDTVARADHAVFAIFDRELDNYGRLPTICQFHDGWLGRTHDHVAIDAILTHHGIVCHSPLPDPGSQEACMLACRTEWFACIADSRDPSGPTRAECAEERDRCEADCR